MGLGTEAGHWDLALGPIEAAWTTSTSGAPPRPGLPQGLGGGLQVLDETADCTRTDRYITVVNRQTRTIMQWPLHTCIWYRALVHAVLMAWRARVSSIANWSFAGVATRHHKRICSRAFSWVRLRETCAF